MEASLEYTAENRSYAWTRGLLPCRMVEDPGAAPGARGIRFPPSNQELQPGKLSVGIRGRGGQRGRRQGDRQQGERD